MSASASWKGFRTLYWLNVEINGYRRTYNDISVAMSMMGFFFPSCRWLESEEGAPYRDSLLLNQVERAKFLLDRRRHDSNKCMPKAHWAEWDKLLEDEKLPRYKEDKAKRTTSVYMLEEYPLEWQKAMRPIIAKRELPLSRTKFESHFASSPLTCSAIFKEGIILNLYTTGASGAAIVAKEPGRHCDLYIDYRNQGPPRIPARLEDPTVSAQAYLTHATHFAKHRPKARFALLRLWSAPHFYPLMLGMDNRVNCSFFDGLERVWAFRFVPKDMPGSEWSIHQAAYKRLAPYDDKLGSYVRVKRDLFIILGEDEEHLRRVATAMTFAIQTRPWQLEVDLWKSFVNVDLDFLLRLDRK
ncbi:MAG: hypothetical protein LQ340_004235 [Diploschistes diacapsis]|nr:MAG: hypothetical protein LQ340_004235 [Diploschistes diacapsis]